MADEQTPVGDPAQKAIPIETMTPESLAEATVADCEQLLTYMHGMMATLRVKQQLVHDVMEAKQREAEIAIKASKMSDEEKAAMLEHLQKPKPPAQHLIGDHITKDNDQVNPGE